VREDEDSGGTRKKKNVLGDSHDVTEEELEAYRMNRRLTEDPMANYVDSGD
jgi:pre-mRNA-processing factor SLU7